MILRVWASTNCQNSYCFEDIVIADEELEGVDEEEYLDEIAKAYYYNLVEMGWEKIDNEEGL